MKSAKLRRLDFKMADFNRLKEIAGDSRQTERGGPAALEGHSSGNSARN